MAKIQITGTPEELDRVATFLRNNNINFEIVNDFGNHSKEDSEKYNKLIERY